MTGLLGAVGGVVKGVAGGVGGVVGGVAAGVRCVARYSLDLPYEDPSVDDEEPNIYEQRARVDQVLQFFEVEFPRYEGYVNDAERLETLRIEYYNCVNAVEFQNDLIAQLVDELLELRASIRSEPQNLKDASIRLANLKLDISDRKNKRFFKGKERRALLETLCPMIGEIKMQRLLEEQENERRPAEDCTSQCGTERSPCRDSSDSRIQHGSCELVANEAWGTEMQAHETSTTSRRRRKHYSDEEITALLREKDY